MPPLRCPNCDGEELTLFGVPEPPAAPLVDRPPEAIGDGVLPPVEKRSGCACCCCCCCGTACACVCCCCRAAAAVLDDDGVGIGALGVVAVSILNPLSLSHSLTLLLLLLYFSSRLTLSARTHSPFLSSFHKTHTQNTHTHSITFTRR